MGKRRVSYFYHPDCPLFYYGAGHPMKPFRLKLTHHLILSYGLHSYMDCYRPHPAHMGEMTSTFHSPDYITFLQKITPDNWRSFAVASRKYNVGPTQDCPAFEGLWEYNQLLAGASIDAAVALCLSRCDIAINWSGGFHHAHKAEAAGFCYVNDIVLAICEMLKVYARVLYIDIDVHHGDGVEEAFYCTDRVMTFSLHKFAPGFFPETGDLPDKGAKEGVGYSLNAPLSSGITDDQYFEDVFRPVFDKILEIFQPGAIFLQCGADSLAADKLGTFNLTTKGHAHMVDYVKSKHIPTLVSGGGGYTVHNVARVWCYETAVLLDKHDIDNEIPFHNYYEYFAPHYELHLLPQQNMDNQNHKVKVDEIRTNLLEQLQDLEGAPGVCMQVVPPLYERREHYDQEDDKEEDMNEDVSGSPTSASKKRQQKGSRKEKKQHEAELYEGVD